MRKKTWFCRLTALAIAFALAIPLSITALATGSYITQVSTEQYTTFLSDFGQDTVTLYATTTNTYADNIPFSTEAEAQAVEWGWTADGMTIYSSGVTSDGQVVITETGSIEASSAPIVPTYAPSGSGYYAYATVELDNVLSYPSTYSLVVKMGAYNYANFTIAIEPLTNYPLPVYSVVKIYDATSSSTLLGATAAWVYRSNYSANYLLNNKTDAYQKWPSAMGVLDALRAASVVDNFTVNAAGSYVSSITIGGNTYSETHSAPYYGWMYGVYRYDSGIGDYRLVEISSAVSASAFPLYYGDRVMWVYGSYGSVPSLWSAV